MVRSGWLVVQAGLCRYLQLCRVKISPLVSPQHSSSEELLILINSEENDFKVMIDLIKALLANKNRQALRVTFFSGYTYSTWKFPWQGLTLGPDTAPGNKPTSLQWILKPLSGS